VTYEDFEDRGFHEVVRHGGGGIGQVPDFQPTLHMHHSIYRRSTLTYKGDDSLPERFQRFYGMITNIDDNFKRLEEKLDQLDLTDNTILIITTDNGTAGGNRLFDAGMKGGKGSVYEGGHRVPLFIRWPNGELTGGRDIDQLVAHYDLLPTFVDLFGFDFIPVKPLDGRSFKPLLYDANANWTNRILYMDTQRKQNLIKYKTYTVMDDNWRLVNGSELYDINADLGQTENVFDQHPEAAARLVPLPFVGFQEKADWRSMQHFRHWKER